MVSTPSALASGSAAQVSQETLTLLAQLIEQMQAPPSATFSATADPDEVLLQVEINGLNYALVRSSPRLERPAVLSPRELAVARLVAQGHPNKRISSLLSISPWTVSTYLRRIFVKLGVTSRTAMVARLMSNHLLETSKQQR